MSRIHILREDGQQDAYEKDEVRIMLEQGVLTSETYFWKEGMPEWRPLGELFFSASPSFVPQRRADNLNATSIQAPALSSPRAVTSRSPVMTRGVQAAVADLGSHQENRWARHYQFRFNPIFLTTVLQVVLLVSLVATAFYIYLCYEKVYGGPDISVTSPGGSSPGTSADLDQQVTGVSSADISYLMTFLWSLLGIHAGIEVLFLIWVYVANLNCRGFVHNLRFTPGWAVGYFFIPIINLFRPYQVMQEIWKVSESPQSWLGTRDSIFVGFWFFCRLTIGILGRGSFHTAYSSSPDLHIRMLGTLMYLMALEINIFFMELTALILVSIVTWRQVQWTRQ